MAMTSSVGYEEEEEEEEEGRRRKNKEGTSYQGQAACFAQLTICCHGWWLGKEGRKEGSNFNQIIV